MNKEELAKYLNTTVCMVETNFPKVKARALKQGKKIIKEGKGNSAVYTIEKTEPQNVNSNYFSSRKKETWTEDIPGEIWITTYQDKDFEVSNFGRVRNKKDLSLRKGSLTDKGYLTVSMNDKKYSLHRVVLASFNPVENIKELTVDHIDGNRSNNFLSNLRWVSNEENVNLMMINRAKLNKELTRLLNIYSYDEVLEILKSIH